MHMLNHDTDADKTTGILTWKRSSSSQMCLIQTENNKLWMSAFVTPPPPVIMVTMKKVMHRCFQPVAYS